MKSCSICNQNYADENLNFCLNDGGILIENRDDAPPTIQMNRGRTTQPNWSEHEPASPWGSQPLQTQNQPYQQQNQVYQTNQPFSPMAMQIPNQTLAIVSLCFGIGSVTIGWCCSLGVILSPAALITGFIALSQIKNDPLKNGGRGLAIGGIVTGAVYLGIVVLLLMIYGLAFLVNIS